MGGGGGGGGKRRKLIGTMAERLRKCRSWAVVAVAAVIGGCAGGAAGTAGDVVPAAGDVAATAGAGEPGSAVHLPEPDLPPRERWAAPFAVSSTGRVEPLRPREVVIVDADPAIAAGLEALRRVRLDIEARQAAAASSRDEGSRVTDPNSDDASPPSPESEAID